MEAYGGELADSGHNKIDRLPDILHMSTIETGPPFFFSRTG